MITKAEAEQIIDSNLDISRLKRIIVDTSAVAWANQISGPKIDKWLDNFKGRYFHNVDCEHKLALWLLHNFTFYTEKDLRILCKKLFDLILHEIIVAKDLSIDEARMEIVNESVFLGLGNGSESGDNTLYRFRQETNLPTHCFDETRKKCKNLILMDDMSFSGEQAKRYINIISQADDSIKADNIYVCYLLVSDLAKDFLNKHFSQIPIVAPIKLDSRDKAFSNDSYAFSNTSFTEIRDFAKEFCEYYGYESVKGMGGYIENYPLGFNDGQYLFGLSYNTPDNTLPIFWGKAEGWYPLFTRYHKNLGDGKEIAIDGRKYY